MHLRISIDGACRRNGKPSCVSSGAAFIQHMDEDNNIVKSLMLSCHEYRSTNQRGELMALVEALEYIRDTGLEAFIITDSEYLFNSMTKQWYTTWLYRGWKTSTGGDVMNSDIWAKICNIMSTMINTEVSFYHVKGHCIPFGKVTAHNSIDNDGTCNELYEMALKKFDVAAPTKKDVVERALSVSQKNNGFKPDMNIFREWVALNTVADAIATKVVDAADQWS